ncbi:MAG: hypothetical protein AAB855_00075, partial [Patescibacteria group bacterium]
MHSTFIRFFVNACSFTIALLGVAVMSVDAVSNKADSVSDRLRGRILLQVESKGEAWYVSPTDGERHYLGRPSDAFRVMREQGLGITNVDL